MLNLDVLGGGEEVPINWIHFLENTPENLQMQL